MKLWDGSLFLSLWAAALIATAIYVIYLWHHPHRRTKSERQPWHSSVNDGQAPQNRPQMDAQLSAGILFIKIKPQYGSRLYAQFQRLERDTQE